MYEDIDTELYEYHDKGSYVRAQQY